MNNKRIGLAGENWAALYIWFSGVRIIKRNWCTMNFEVDIIGYINQTVIFFEVKTLVLTSNTKYLDLKARVKPKQLRHLHNAAAIYVKLNNKSANFCFRFDIIEVILIPKKLPKIKWLKGIKDEY